MQKVMMLVATLSFFTLLATAILTGFDVVPFNIGFGVALSSFLLAVLAIGLVFYPIGESDE